MTPGGILGLLIGLVHCKGLLASSTGSSAPLPDAEVAGRSPNAFRIFNSVHSALRQWGSSIQHNGLSFIPVTIPEGNLFYHGRHSPDRPETLEWLAFEMEHASQFAQCWEFNNSAPSTSMLNRCFKMVHERSLHGKVSSMQSQVHETRVAGEQTTGVAFVNDDQLTLNRDDDRDHRPPPDARGYLQTYRATRPLNLLYLDGMAAAKCHLGTLDSQNLILLDWTDDPDPMRNEWGRAAALCELAGEWALDGFVRMEAGFEVIYCDFSEGLGLDLVSTHGSPWRNETHAPPAGDSAAGGPVGEWFVMGMFEWMRASASRYPGLPRGRAEIDFGGMVSAFTYDVNTTNPDPKRPDLPRLVSATAEERSGIRDRVGEVVRARRKGKTTGSVDWQAVVDNIVTRFADRLWFLSENQPSAREFRSQLATLLYPFLDFPEDMSLEDVSEPLARCTDIHLAAAIAKQTSWTPEDRAIYAAIRAVSHAICSGLFAMRREIHTTNGTTSGDVAAAQKVQKLARELRTQLDWTAWKECERCAHPDEVCFVAMFPAGGLEDHFKPRCKTQDEIGFGYFSDPGF